MAWFGESFSSWTGPIKNFTKEVLSEASDETEDTTIDLKVTKEKLEELEAVCTAQDLEISALKKQNAELRRRLEEVGGLEDGGLLLVPPGPTTWLSIEQRCDAGYTAGSQTNGTSGNKGHTRALSDVTSVAAKHQERLEKELRERVQLIEHLQMQLQKVEEERHTLFLKTSEQENKIKELLKSVPTEEVVKAKECLVQNREEMLIQENTELKSLLNDANRRTIEMEEELMSMRNQCLDQVIDSQVSASELRLDIEHTRKRIANETGVQRAERLRAHQDMVNRMIQMGEKTRETEQSVKKIQNEDRKLAAEMASKIQKLGDQEQQDLIHGTLKALELENQVLNMRNAQLERESLKELGKSDDHRKSYPDGIDHRNRSGEVVKSEDDMDNLSFQSELSDFTVHNHRLENQIAQLQNQVEIYKRDVKHYEMLRDNASHEKSDLEEQVKYLKEQLKEKQELHSTPLLQCTYTQTDSTEEMDCVLQISTADKLKELEVKLEKSKETMKSLHEEKQYFGQELEAMARVVQDLEAKVAVGNEERQGLIASMEELDQQHQDAIDKLLGLRNADQEENEKLKSQVMELQTITSYKPQMIENAVQTDLFISSKENVTQTESINLTDQQNQTSGCSNDKETSTDNTEDKIINDADRDTFKYDSELSEKIRKLINFDIPNDFNNTVPQSLYLVQEIVKFTNDCKWKKDTLERKVSELIRESKDYKSTITILEAECSNLKDNVERLAEQLVGVAKSGKDPLPTILENCEEMEVMEQKIAMLEEEVDVLRETRVNLEEDAARMREDRHDLVTRIRNSEAEQRNKENLETELQKLTKDTLEYKVLVEELKNDKASADAQVQSLTQELEICAKMYEKELQEVKEAANVVDLKNGELLQSAISNVTGIEELQNKISDLQIENSLLTVQLQQKSLGLEENVSQLKRSVEERESLQTLLTDLQNQCQGSEEVEMKLVQMADDLEQCMITKLEVDRELNITKKSLQEAQTCIKKQEILESEVVKWQNAAVTEEIKVKDTLLSVLNLEKESKNLQEKLCNEEIAVKNLTVLNEQHVKQIKELEMKVQLVSDQLSSVTHEELKLELTQLASERDKLEQSMMSVHHEKEMLSKELESLTSQLSQKEHTEKELLQAQLDLKVQMNDEAELHMKYQTEFIGLQDENQELRNKIKTMECDAIDSMQLSGEIKSLNSQLSVALDEKNDLNKENEELKKSLLEKNAFHSNNRSNFAENESNVLVKNSNHQVSAKLKTDDAIRITDLACHSDMPSYSTERENQEMSEMKQLNEKNQQVLLLLQERNQEIGMLQTKLDNIMFEIEGSKETIKSLEEQKESIMNEKIQIQDKFEMTKESISKLSEMIKEKDKELDTLKVHVSHLTTEVQKSESFNKQLMLAQESAIQIIRERDQLLLTVQVKHQESVQYHAEIQRLSVLLSQELAKNQQVTSQYTTLVQKYNDEKVNTSPKHLQELKDLQDLIKVKDEGLQQLCNRLELKEHELQARGLEMETLRHQVELLTYERTTHQAGLATAVQQDEGIQEKYDDLASKSQDEQRKCKQLQNELEVSLGRETALQKELERLRVHLVEIEDVYTQEALKTEEHIKELTNKLQQADEMMKSSSTVYKSANIRANQQVETLHEQARLIAQQRDDVQAKLSAAEDQVAKHSAALHNLQAVLEQFQRDREREIDAARAAVYVKVEAAQKRHNELLEEILSFKLQLKEAKEGLSAASRLGEELERKGQVVIRLKQEAMVLEEKLKKAEEAAKTVVLSVEGKVDKSLVKNVVLGFFLAPSNSKEQVLHVVASVLDFTDDEKSRVQKRLGLHSSDGSGGWFKSLLHPAGQDQSSSSQSLSEAFVRFLENESIPQPKLKMLPDSEKPATASSVSSRTTPVNTQRKSPLLLADVQLPTFAQFPVGRNSSSILKDILKES